MAAQHGPCGQGSIQSIDRNWFILTVMKTSTNINFTSRKATTINDTPQRSLTSTELSLTVQDKWFLKNKIIHLTASDYFVVRFGTQEAKQWANHTVRGYKMLSKSFLLI